MRNLVFQRKPAARKARPRSWRLALALRTLPVAALAVLLAIAYLEHARKAYAEQRLADINCLAENIYFEARGEPLAGQFAVAEVTLNRVDSPRFPANVCDVVHEARWSTAGDRLVGQFSWTVAESLPQPSGIAWQRAVAAASTIYDNREAPLVDGALFYHADYVSPTWARSKYRAGRIGRHLFYY